MTGAARQAARVPHGPAIDRADADALIERYVQEDPNGRGRHRAYVAVDERTWSPIWVIAGVLRHGGTPAEAAAAYELPDDAVAAALAFYDRHRDVFDAWLLLNEQP